MFKFNFERILRSSKRYQYTNKDIAVPSETRKNGEGNDVKGYSGVIKIKKAKGGVSMAIRGTYTKS